MNAVGEFEVKDGHVIINGYDMNNVTLAQAVPARYYVVPCTSDQHLDLNLTLQIFGGPSINEHLDPDCHSSRQRKSELHFLVAMFSLRGLTGGNQEGHYLRTPTCTVVANA